MWTTVKDEKYVNYLPINAEKFCPIKNNVENFLRLLIYKVSYEY